MSKNTGPSRIVLTYPQQKAVEKWLEQKRPAITGESWGVERVAVESSAALGFRVTGGNLRTIMAAMEPPLELTTHSFGTNFLAPIQRRVDEFEADTNRRLDALEGESTQQSLRVQSLAARVEDALALLATLEAASKRIGAGVAENREQLAVARTEIAKALTELGFRKIDQSVSRAALQSIAHAEQKSESK